MTEPAQATTTTTSTTAPEPAKGKGKGKVVLDDSSSEEEEIVYKRRPEPATVLERITQECWTHHTKEHDIFIVFRVISEGQRMKNSIEKDAGGLAELLYNKLNAKKKPNGKTAVPFLDSKCLNFGQSWEDGFLYGAVSSKVHMIMLSEKALEGLVEFPPKRQDNLLIIIELALLQHAAKGTKVFTVFCGEHQDKGGEPRPFDDKKVYVYPDTPHERDKSAPEVHAELYASLPEEKKAFMGSVAKTMAELFKHPTRRLNKRADNMAELNEFLDYCVSLIPPDPK